MPLSAEEQQERIQVVHRNSLRLLKLVNTLLDFSRIEAGRIHATPEPVDLSVLTKDLASAFRSAMEKAGLKFDVHCEQLPRVVSVDSDMWEKIVFNLLSNAFKFTLEGAVTVTLKGENGEAVLQVSDSGTGIPEQELPNVFKRFHRVQNAHARTHEGTGIGLALVQDLVNLHGGSISLESKIGKGSTFTVRIPFGNQPALVEHVAQPRKQSPARVPVGDLFVEEANRWLPAGPAQNGKAEKSAVTPSNTTEQLPRVVVADDNADMRDYIGRLLQGRYELEIVRDGHEALLAARRKKPDLIISDIMMPNVDGISLLNAVREDSAFKTLPVILLSARAGNEARVDGIEKGADDYLVKPFNGRELVARVETQLRLSRMRREKWRKDRER